MDSETSLLAKVYAPTSYYSPQLKQVEGHSKNLSLIASMGLEALDKIKSGAKDARWTNEKLTV